MRACTDKVSGARSGITNIVTRIKNEAVGKGTAGVPISSSVINSSNNERFAANDGASP